MSLVERDRAINNSDENFCPIGSLFDNQELNGIAFILRCKRRKGRKKRDLLFIRSNEIRRYYTINYNFMNQ